MNEYELGIINNSLIKTEQNISLSKALKCDANTYALLLKVYLDSVKEEHRKGSDVW